MHSTKRETPCS
ncbi:hypothetical protein Patl1_31232 [Pistacia atlantica]|uniref:Uncharacterized protein n=1 Tax=Pistacia atlantica TaxID=434234 RepID=A0ACC1AD02_9ROSI|nr:hypothetical protein Patl1_31232 [Pistacia atlantica]